MTVDEKGLIAGQRAAMESNGCGCSWGEEHVFCDDPRLPEPDTSCQCKKDALAAITAYESARSAEPVATAPAEGDAYYFATMCWGAEWTNNEWGSLVDFADLHARNRTVIEVVPSGIDGRLEP